MATKQLQQSGAVDVFAACVSTLCLVHCLLLPLLVTVTPLVALLSGNPLVHRSLVLLAVPATLWAVWKTPLLGAGWLFVVPALAGLTLLLLAAFVEYLAPYEESLTVAGASMLVAAHLWRWRRGRGTRSLGRTRAEGGQLCQNRR